MSAKPKPHDLAFETTVWPSDDRAGWYQAEAATPWIRFQAHGRTAEEALRNVKAWAHLLVASEPGRA